MHLSDGELRAYLDHQIDCDDLPRIEAHLDSCSRCQEKQAEIIRSGAQVREHLSALDPAKGSHPLTVNQARVRLEARVQKKESNNMLDKIFSKPMRPVWITLVVVAILAISLTFAPVRAIANNFLGLFRVEQFAVVEINPADFSQQFGSSTQLEAMLSEDVQVEERGEPISVEDKQHASQYVDFDVRLPAGMNKPLESLTVQPGGRATFTVDASRVQAFLNEIERSDIQVPAGVDGATVALEIPEGIQAEYGVCDFDPEKTARDYDPDSPTVPRLPDCTTLIQIPSPTITAPPGLNLTLIGEAYLQLLGMSRSDAEKFAQQVDWTTTLVIPLPLYATQYEEVPVDGVTGILIQQELDDQQNQYMLLWTRDGIVYALTGPGTGTTAANITRTLQ
jgi:hypothetical protein